MRYSKKVGIGYRSLRSTEEGSGTRRSENACRAVNGAAGFRLPALACAVAKKDFDGSLFFIIRCLKFAT